MHYKKLFDDSAYLFAHDLDGKDVVVTIESVKAGEIVGEKGLKSRKPMISFVGKTKVLAANRTNAKIIANLYGNDTTKWVGKQLCLYPTTTNFSGSTVDCIRCRPAIPAKEPTK